MTDKIAAMTADINLVLSPRYDHAPNDNFAKNMQREIKSMTAPTVVGYMVDNELKAEPLSDIAIYALQKVSRLIEFFVGAAKSIDPYSLTILKNAAALSEKGIAYSSELVKAGLSKHCDAPEKLKLATRYTCSVSTAGTQMSSSVAAFEYLGLAKRVGGKKGSLAVDLDHPIVCKALGREMPEVTEAEADELMVALATEVEVEIGSAEVVKYGKKSDTRIDQWTASGAMLGEAVASL